MSLSPKAYEKFKNELHAGGAPARRILNPSWRKRQPYGSTMTIQVWSRHSPFKVVADAFICSTKNTHPI